MQVIVKRKLIIRSDVAVNNRFVQYLAQAGYVLERSSTENAFAVEKGIESLLARGPLVDVADNRRSAPIDESNTSYYLSEEESIGNTPVGAKIHSIINELLADAYVEPLFNIYDLNRQGVYTLLPMEKLVVSFFKATVWLQPSITSKTILGTRLLEARGTKVPSDLSLLIVRSNSPDKERRAVRLLTNYPGLDVDAIIAIDKGKDPTLIYSRRNGGQHDH